MYKGRGQGSGVGGWVKILKSAPGPRTPAPFLIAILLFFGGCKGARVSLPTLPSGVINISNSETPSTHPAAAASGNTVYVVWTDAGPGPQNLDIFLRRSADGGATFGAPINVSQSAAASGNAKIALAGTSVYVAWEEFVPTHTPENNETDIFFRRADDQNGTLIWAPPLDQPGRNLSASPPVCGPAKSAPCPSQNATIAASGDNVFVAWGEATDYDFKVTGQSTDFVLINSNILMMASFDRGVTFSPTPIEISGPKTSATPCAATPESPSINPTLAAGSSGPLYIAWEDCKSPGAKILFRRFPDQLAPLVSVPPLDQSAISRLAGSINGSTRPALAADGNTLFLLWEGSPAQNTSCPLLASNGAPVTNSEILLIRSDDRGVHFTDPNDLAQSNLSNTVCASSNGKIAFSPPFVSVAWEDNTPGLTGISLKKSTDGGLTFGAAADLAQTGGSVADPALAASGGDLFALWEDSTLGNIEILFARR